MFLILSDFVKYQNNNKILSPYKRAVIQTGFKNSKINRS